MPRAPLLDQEGLWEALVIVAKQAGLDAVAPVPKSSRRKDHPRAGVARVPLQREQWRRQPVEGNPRGQLPATKGKERTLPEQVPVVVETQPQKLQPRRRIVADDGVAPARQEYPLFAFGSGKH